jgi:hypothetical protein
MIAWSEEKKRRAIRRYFEHQPNWAGWSLVLVGIGSSLIWDGRIGIAILVAGIVVLLLRRRQRGVSDAQIDEWTRQEFRNHDFVRRAAELSMFDRLVRQPMLLTGLATAGLQQGALVARVEGDDGTFRHTPLSATVLLCSPLQLGIYQTGLDLTTGNRINETFIEVFYQDVVAISATSNTTRYDVDASEAEIKAGGASPPALLQVIAALFAAIAHLFRRARALSELKRTRARLAKHLIAGTFQFERSTSYRIDFVDGAHVEIPVYNGRSTREANATDAARSGDEAAQSIATLRQFVREMKRAALGLEPTPSSPLV